MPTDRVFESSVDRQIREAAERGEFENLAGSGQPIPDLDATYDPAWWARRFIRRENANVRADDLRRLIRSEVPHLRVASDRQGAEVRVAEINEMIEAANKHLAPEDWVPLLSL